jgi:predicted permease
MEEGVTPVFPPGDRSGTLEAANMQVLSGGERFVLRLPFELLPSLSLGFVLGLARQVLPDPVIPGLIRWGIPLSLTALLLRSPFTVSLLKVGVLGCVVPLLSLWIVQLIALHQRFQHPVLLLGASLGNTGYWGLPVALALLPPEALAVVIVYDMAGTFVTWSVGPLVLRGGWRGFSELGPILCNSPAVQAVLLSILVALTPWQKVLAQWLWWPARGVLWLALIVVGMRLGAAVRSRSLAFCHGVTWALAFKLLVVPAIVWFLATVLRFTPLDRSALVLQGAAPTALSVLLLAEMEQDAVSLATTVVLVSTILAMVTVPLWWSVLR